MRHPAKRKLLHNIKADSSGMLLVESAIYLPIVLLALFAFMLATQLITQRVVLDRAVAQVTAEAAAFLSTSQRKYDVDDVFYGSAIRINTNPYHALIDNLFNAFHPFENDAAFEARVEELINNQISWTLLGSRGSELDINIEYTRHFFISGELMISARQSANFPLNLRLIGMDWDVFNFTAYSRARTGSKGNIINDVTFGFDVLRHVTGLDVGKLSGFVGDLPNRANNLLKSVPFFGDSSAASQIEGMD